MNESTAKTVSLLLIAVLVGFGLGSYSIPEPSRQPTALVFTLKEMRKRLVLTGKALSVSKRMYEAEARILAMEIIRLRNMRPATILGCPKELAVGITTAL